jgi:hypothetical protein
MIYGQRRQSFLSIIIRRLCCCCFTKDRISEQEMRAPLSKGRSRTSKSQLPFRYRYCFVPLRKLPLPPKLQRLKSKTETIWDDKDDDDKDAKGDRDKEEPPMTIAEKLRRELRLRSSTLNAPYQLAMPEKPLESYQSQIMPKRKSRPWKRPAPQPPLLIQQLETIPKRPPRKKQLSQRISIPSPSGMTRFRDSLRYDSFPSRPLRKHKQ